MPYEFTLKRMVEFAETDMAGIMHFSNYFRFMEATEHAFFRSLGLQVHSTGDEPSMRGWARVRAECNYRRPLRYEEVVDVRLLVREKRTKSIAYAFVFEKDGQAVAEGSVTVVCVERATGDTELRAVEIPAEIAERVEVAPREVLDAIEAGKH
jgi:acyl-CoA thioester hydrolase